MFVRKFILFALYALLMISLFPEEVLAAPRQQNVKEKPVIVIDPGHGGENLGTIENNHEEKSMTLTTALAMYEELLQYDNVEVYLTRTDDRDMSLRERAQFAKSVNADFLFSIHYNASEEHQAYGSEVWVPMHSPYSEYGYQFAYEALTDMRRLGLFIRGIKTRPGEKNLDYYGILRESVALEVPAVIIEHCHVDEARDEGFCDSEEKLQHFGRLDATAVARYFGLKSSALNVDYSGYELADASNLTSLDARTAPEECTLAFAEADYEAGKLTLSVSGTDSDSALLYYSYSTDGGATFSQRETWPESDALTGDYKGAFLLELNIAPGDCPEVVVRAYNGFDMYTESNHYESPCAFPFPPAQEVMATVPSVELEEEPEAETEEFKDINVVFAILMLTIAIILTMLFAAQIVETNRRKKRRRRLQAMKEEGWSRNQLR